MNNANSHYEDKICEAIEYIVENAVSKAQYDKTIQATVVKVVDQTIGKYSVKYQDSIFYAYASSADVKYTKGTEVYILIPGNDTSRDKTILGSTKKLGVDYINNPEGEDSYEVIGANVLTNAKEFGLCSYYGEQTQIVYDRENNINEIGLDATAAEVYIKQSSAILCGSTIRTALPSEQQLRGNYGIVFELAFANSAGDVNIKNYVLDVNQIQGNPYKLIYDSRQFSVFEIDGENFQYVNKIYFFVSNFPNNAENKPNDIFIKNLELSAVEKLSTEALNSYALSFITLQGTYFDASHLDTETKSIQAQVRIKGKAIDKDSQNLDYYWFIENAAINYMSEKYNRYGGSGWECINEYNLMREGADGEPPVIEWIPASYEIKVAKSDILGKERKYKCVAIYNDENVVSREITITNFTSLYELTIESSEGNQFYFDIGNPTLTCKINGEERLEGYTYSWGRIDNNGNFSTLVSTKENMIIENNKVYNFYIGDIITFNIIKCSVSYNGNYLGTAEITLLNSMEKDEDNPDYSLIINNGTQVFKYNEAGVSPASGSLEVPMMILPLSFSLYNDIGQLISDAELASAKIQWKVPTDNTMLVLTDVKKPDIVNIDHVIYENDLTANYLIRDFYDASRNDNNITLSVEYNGLVLTAVTNFTFLKEGDNGTNGTEYVCKIVPNVATGDIPVYPMIMNGALNYTPPMDECWFKVQLWRNGEKIFENNTSGNSEEKSAVSVKWSVLKNKYGTQIINGKKVDIADASAITVTDEVNGYFSYNGYLSDAANIIKCELTYKDLTYYATLPLITAWANEGYENIKLKDYSGFRYVVYTTDGLRPQYADNPFELENVDGLTLRWGVVGQIHNGTNWINNSNLEIKNGSPLECRPLEKYSGECVTNGLECAIESGIETVARIHIPIHLMLNRYGNSAMNGWDGNSISISDEGGFILAPQIGAGRKESNNSFTGMFMGEVKEAGKSNTEVGLFGYSSGIRTMFLNAEDGSAAFGVASIDGGQIIVQPGRDPVIKSNNFSTADDIGLEINFSSTPSITFGSGNFAVNAEGKLTVKEATINGSITATGGTIGGFTIEDTYLYNGKSSLASSSAGVYIGTDGISVGSSGKKYVQLKKNGGLIAKTGEIANFILEETSLYTGAKSSLTDENSGIYIGEDGIALGASSAFSVAENGDLTVNGGSINLYLQGFNTLNPVDNGSPTFNFYDIKNKALLGRFYFWDGDSPYLVLQSHGARPITISAETGQLTLAGGIVNIGGNLAIGSSSTDYTVTLNGEEFGATAKFG